MTVPDRPETTAEPSSTTSIGANPESAEPAIELAISAEPATPSRPDDALTRAAQRIASADRLLITSHRGPDGDSLGSMIALASLLREHGKTAVLYNPDSVPRRFKWLPLSRSFHRKLGAMATYDVTVVVDCADPKLLGSKFPGPEVTGELIVLDHHSSATSYGDIYVCDPEASSVGVLVARIARTLDWTFTDDAALAIYVSLASDTGTFRYANTNSEALRLAADLVELGVDPWHVSEQMHERSSLTRYKLLSAVIERIELAHHGKVALFVLTGEILQEVGASWEDSVDLVNYARALKGVECGVLLSPTRHGGIRVSMRSKGHIIDAGAVCADFGGGGHRGAAGCVLQGDLSQARERVLQVLGDILSADTPATDGPVPVTE